VFVACPQLGWLLTAVCDSWRAASLLYFSAVQSWPLTCGTDGVSRWQADPDRPLFRPYKRPGRPERRSV